MGAPSGLTSSYAHPERKAHPPPPHPWISAGRCTELWDGREGRARVRELGLGQRQQEPSRSETKTLGQTLEDTCIFHRGAQVPEGLLSSVQRPRPHFGSEPRSGTQKAGQEMPRVLSAFPQASGKLQTQFPGCTLHSCLVMKSPPCKGRCLSKEHLLAHKEVALETTGISSGSSRGIPGAPTEQGQEELLPLPLTVSCSPLWSSCTRRGSGSVPSGQCWGDTNHTGNVTFLSPSPSPGELPREGDSSRAPDIPLWLQGMLLRRGGTGDTLVLFLCWAGR